MNKGKTWVFCIFCIILIFVALGQYTLLLLSGACCIQCSIEGAFTLFLFLFLSHQLVQFNCLSELSVRVVLILLWKLIFGKV